jgi:hypothetical protein
VGTSKNVPSPDTPPWRPVFAVLGKSNVAPDRQLREIWRAASAERGPELADLYSQTSLAAAFRTAMKAASVQEALAAHDNEVRASRSVGFAVEVSRRALARCVAAKTGGVGFAAELFAEATAYYVSRDLPSVLARRGCVGTSSEASALKASILSSAKLSVRQAVTTAPEGADWSLIARQALSSLRGDHS